MGKAGCIALQAGSSEVDPAFSGRLPVDPLRLIHPTPGMLYH